MHDQPQRPYMTVDEYLKFEEASDVRHEYVDGQVFDMTGATQAHNMICGNLFARLHGHLQGTGCRAFHADMKVHVKAANSLYYPDILVTCEAVKATSVLIEHPVLIIEVLSSSTKHIDRREKLVNYRKIESVREYILVHQNKMLVEVFRRNSDGTWLPSQLTKFESLLLQSMPDKELTIAVQDIYAGLDLPSRVQEPEEEYSY
jgi:Uma2 family endonuclease